MKLKFKVQPYQTNAVEAVVDCFAGQVNTTGIKYRVDPGMVKDKGGKVQESFLEVEGFKNADIQLSGPQVLDQYPRRPATAEPAHVGLAGEKCRLRRQSGH